MGAVLFETGGWSLHIAKLLTKYCLSLLCFLVRRGSKDSIGTKGRHSRPGSTSPARRTSAASLQPIVAGGFQFNDPAGKISKNLGVRFNTTVYPVEYIGSQKAYITDEETKAVAVERVLVSVF